MLINGKPKIVVFNANHGASKIILYLIFFRHVLHLYPIPKETKTLEEAVKIPSQSATKSKLPPPPTHKENEMKRVRKDLVKYSQALDVVVRKLNEGKFVDDLKHNGNIFLKFLFSH